MAVKAVAGCQVALRGPLDVLTVSDVRAALHAAIDAGTGDLVVDVSAVELVDATGMGVLVGANRRAALAGRRLVLRGVPPRLARILRVTRLYRVLAIEPSTPGELDPVALA
jgi:anti-sigma B factor antagonist